MFKIAQVIQNIKTDLTSFSWTSDDGGGTSSFNAVYAFDHYSNAAGSPFVVLNDTPSNPDGKFNKYITFEHTINIEICVNYAGSDPEDIVASQEEAMLRLREAWDALRVHLVKDTTMNTYLGIMKGWTRGFDATDEHMPELNLFRRIARIRIKETTLRY